MKTAAQAAIKKANRGVMAEIAVISVLLIFIAFSFYTFIKDNNQRILEQNDGIIEAAAEQTADRLNDLFNMSQRNLEIMAYLYGSIMTPLTMWNLFPRTAWI